MRLLVATVFCGAGAFSAVAGPVQLPVPRMTIYPGQVIEPGMLVERAFNDPMGAIPTSDAIVGRVARQTLLPGRPISTAALRAPHAITQGQAALVVFQSGALTISGNAVALQSGAAGDVISLRNADSGRIIRGIIGSDGAVHVGDQ